MKKAIIQPMAIYRVDLNFVTLLIVLKRKLICGWLKYPGPKARNKIISVKDILLKKIKKGGPALADALSDLSDAKYKLCCRAFLKVCDKLQ